MKFLLGVKQQMTRIFDEQGRVQPATIISAGPMTVSQIKTRERDGYRALQFGYGRKKAKNLAKPQRRELFRYRREWRLPDGFEPELVVGQTVNVSIFAPGDKVAVSGVSKGKGFQGVVKRHGFAGGPRTHGQKHAERKPGSIGGGLRTRVPKGMRMAGRMGGQRVTVKNLRVLQIDQDTNTLVLSGAIPGRRGSLLEIKSYK